MMNTDSIVQAALNDQFCDVDIFDYITEEEQAEMLREVFQRFVGFKSDKSLTTSENSRECLLEMTGYMEQAISYFIDKRYPRKVA